MLRNLVDDPTSFFSIVPRDIAHEVQRWCGLSGVLSECPVVKEFVVPRFDYSHEKAPSCCTVVSAAFSPNAALVAVYRMCGYLTVYNTASAELIYHARPRMPLFTGPQQFEMVTSWRCWFALSNYATFYHLTSENSLIELTGASALAVRKHPCTSAGSTNDIITVAVGQTGNLAVMVHGDGQHVLDWSSHSRILIYSSDQTLLHTMFLNHPLCNPTTHTPLRIVLDDYSSHIVWDLPYSVNRSMVVHMNFSGGMEDTPPPTRTGKVWTLAIDGNGSAVRVSDYGTITPHLTIRSLDYKRVYAIGVDGDGCIVAVINA